MNSWLLATILVAALGTGPADLSAQAGLDPDPAAAMHRVRVRVVGTLLEQGRTELALKAAGALVRDRPGDAPTRIALGRALEANGLLEEAARAYEEAARLAKRDPVPRALLARVLSHEGRTDEALSHLRRAVELSPFTAALWNDLGFTLLLSGRPGEAVEALERAVDLDPAGRRARSNLGFALAALGRDDEALRSFRALLRPADAYANLGLAREKRGDVPGALDLYRAALRLDPSCEAARANLERHASAAATVAPTTRIPASAPDEELSHGTL
ncbi:tetratricopeptide repeat protein [Myxococcota bacterium]|nr:tetratricopeptide repeat protein [Myxococcota bacterium]